jgi:hypothetical protein
MDSIKEVFGPYSNGEGMVYGDPLRIHRRLTAGLRGDPNTVIKDSNSEDPAVSYPATERLVQAVIQAFEMKPFDPATGKGATTDLALSTLATFTEWLRKKG